jgi:DNA-directed RNA polymerase specialized sigma24 family protein
MIAWDVVVPALSPALRRLIGRRLRWWHVQGDTEDLLQDTYLRVLQAEARGLIAPRDLSAYLFRVAGRVAYDYVRDGRAQKRGGGAIHHQLSGLEAIADTRPA